MTHVRTRARALVTAHSADFATFGVAVAVLPAGYEANPLAHAAYVAAGLPAVAALKMGALWLALAILGRLGRSWLAWPAVTIGWLVGVAGTTSNLLAVWLWA